jgi:glycosyltransferase involved in cell wall biosynthesis
MLEEAVASVSAQTFSDWELIVVDDASTDGTPQWLEGVQTDRIRWLRQETNAGESAARNRGMLESRSPLILFLDDDDLLRPSALERLVGRARKNDDVVGVIGGAKVFDPEGNERKITHVWFRRRREIWPDVLLGWVPVICCTVLRKEAVTAIGGFDEEIRAGEDVEMFLRLGAQGPFLVIPEVVVSKRTHSGQVRFADSAQVNAEFKQRFAESLGGVRRERAERAIKSHDIWKRADWRYAKGDPRAALKGFVETARLKEVHRSPIRRAYLAKDLAKGFWSLVLVALVGQRRALQMRTWYQRVSRSFLKRHPKAERTFWTR